MQEKFGVSAIRKFDIQIIDGNGYGVWWDREISDSGEDELVLYTNDNKAKSEDYKYIQSFTKLILDTVIFIIDKA